MQTLCHKHTEVRKLNHPYTSHQQIHGTPMLKAETLVMSFLKQEMCTLLMLVLEHPHQSGFQSLSQKALKF
jgi:hypothetical protein